MKFLAAALLSTLALPAFAQSVYHQGYTNRNGTYVAPHYQSAPNSTPMDNYSTRGNTNPYTGQPGTVTPQPQFGYQPSPQPHSYGQPSAPFGGFQPQRR